MPITAELENIQKLEDVEFSHDQAKVLVGIIEQAQVDSQQDLKDFIRTENEKLYNNLRNEFKQDVKDLDGRLSIGIKDLDGRLSIEIKDLEIRLLNHQRDLLIKIVGIFSALLGVAVAIIKLF